jgi:hypothetical protein
LHIELGDNSAADLVSRSLNLALRKVAKDKLTDVTQILKVIS